MSGDSDSLSRKMSHRALFYPITSCYRYCQPITSCYRYYQPIIMLQVLSANHIMLQVLSANHIMLQVLSANLTMLQVLSANHIMLQVLSANHVLLQVLLANHRTHTNHLSIIYQSYSAAITTSQSVLFLYPRFVRFSPESQVVSWHAVLLYLRWCGNIYTPFTLL